MDGSADIKRKALAIPISAGIRFRISALLLDALKTLKDALLERIERGKSGHRHMVLVESLSLGNRRQLFLVVCDEHRFLVGAGADRVGTVIAMAATTTDVAPFQPSTTQRKPVSAQAGYRRPEWMRSDSGEAGGTRGLQLVKRDIRLNTGTLRLDGSEAGRTQW